MRLSLDRSLRASLLWLAAVWIALCATSPLAHAEQLIPTLQARVTDLAGMLTPAQRDALERRLADFEQRTTDQLVILIMPTTQPETIEQYSIRVAEQWKLGQKGRDNGVLILVAMEDRTLRIEVGYGLEGDLTDLHSSRIIREIIGPRFQKGDYYGGLDAGLNAIMARLEGGAAIEAPATEDASSLRSVEGRLPFLFVMSLIVGRILQAIFSSLFSAALSGAIVGAVTYFLTGSLVAAILFGLFAAFLGLVSWGGQRGGFAGRSGHGWGRWPDGGGFGGGGFRGGGGGFGGGGASGRW